MSDSKSGPPLPLLQARLLDLSRVLDTSEAIKGPEGVALTIGRRCREHFRVAIAADADATAMINMRPLALAIILLRWIQQDPPLRTDLWIAQGELDERKMIEAARRNTEVAASWPAPDPARQADHEAFIAAARRVAGEEGASWVGGKGDLLPGESVMADAVNTEQVRQAYDIAYRVSSMWGHLSAGSFKNALEQREDGLYLAGPETTWVDGTRTMATSLFAIVLAIVSELAGLGIEREASLIRAIVVDRGGR
jgi:hypothetical protein